VHLAELTAAEQRVLGCLIEKRLTTPDAYPLSLNALRLACNQSTNRDPVTDYDEATVRDAAQRLSRYGLARLASGAGSRAVKYRHLAEDALQLGPTELALLGVLLLRGPQTPGELKSRTDRMAHFDSIAELELALELLIDRDYVKRIPRRPGQKGIASPSCWAVTAGPRSTSPQIEASQARTLTRPPRLLSASSCWRPRSPPCARRCHRSDMDHSLST
jgi:uncharacterized protein YceH (UPF0502 family)